MADKIKLGKKQYTAAEITANCQGQTRGDDHITKLAGVEYLYQYRTEYPNGLYEEYRQPVCDPSKANYLQIMDRDGHYIGRVYLS